MNNGRTIAIGDMHGCADALAALLRVIDPRQEDTLVPLGDYIDRGPDSRRVVEQLLALRSKCRLLPLRGNHEIMLLDALESPSERRLWLQCGGRQTMDSYGGSFDKIPESHLEFFASCLPYHETASHLFLHASYDALLPLDQQSDYMLYWCHILANLPPPHCSGKIAVVGHTPQTSGEIRDAGHLLMIDTFCFGNGWLTAIDVTNNKVWQVDKFGQLRSESSTQLKDI